jgi:hypothetical protein
MGPASLEIGMDKSPVDRTLSARPEDDDDDDDDDSELSSSQLAVEAFSSAA